MDRRRPRMAGADDLAEESNKTAEDMGLVPAISKSRTDDQLLDENEPKGRDYRSGVTTNPPEPVAPPYKNLRGS